MLSKTAQRICISRSLELAGGMKSLNAFWRCSGFTSDDSAASASRVARTRTASRSEPESPRYWSSVATSAIEVTEVFKPSFFTITR